MSPLEAYQFGLLPLVVWREARNQTHATKVAVAWSIRNRIEHHKWWGYDYPSVILMAKQYSSFNTGDKNSTKFPGKGDPDEMRSFHDCLEAAFEVFSSNVPDPTGGATSYHDHSIEPPYWALKMTKTVEIGAFSFYRE